VDVSRQYCRTLSDLLYGQLLVFILDQKIEHTVRPVADVGAMAEVTKWLLRGSLFTLNQRKLIAKIDQELSIAEPLPCREHHDA